MTAPPTTTTLPPDLAGNHEGGLRSLRQEAQAFVAEYGLRLSGSHQRRLIAEYERTGGVLTRMAFRSYLAKRGDVIEVRQKKFVPWRARQC